MKKNQIDAQGHETYESLKDVFSPYDSRTTRSLNDIVTYTGHTIAFWYEVSTITTETEFIRILKRAIKRRGRET